MSEETLRQMHTFYNARPMAWAGVAYITGSRGSTIGVMTGRISNFGGPLCVQVAVLHVVLASLQILCVPNVSHLF